MEPEFPFGSEELRFQQRFLLFQRMSQPQPLSFQSFKETTDLSTIQTTQVLALISSSLKIAKAGCEKLLKINENPLLKEQFQALTKVEGFACA
jgi:hypothetical protein